MPMDNAKSQTSGSGASYLAYQLKMLLVMNA